jgi:hypothetical protein
MPSWAPGREAGAMTSSATAAAGGLYSFKSWYAGRLAPVRRRLVAAGVPPWAITLAGIGFGSGAPTWTAGWPATGIGPPRLVRC